MTGKNVFMNNKSLWILAAIAFGGTMTFTSCKDNEEKTDEEDQTVAIVMPADPTEDRLGVKVEGPPTRTRAVPSTTTKS